MPRADKEAKVKEISVRLTESQAAVLAGYRGLTVHEAAELRAALAEVDTRFSVVKNSLTRLAVKDAGLEGLTELIDGPMAIAFVLGDPVAGAKRLVEEARRFPVLEVRGGFAEGRILSADDVRALAALEPREVMLAKLAGMPRAQLTRMAWVLQALQSRFVALMSALKEKLPEADEAEQAPAASATEDHPDPERPGAGEEETTPEPGPGEPAEPAEPAEEPADTEPARTEGQEEAFANEPGETEGGT